MQFDFDDAAYNAPVEPPKRVGIQRNLITGEIVDYNAGLVFNPTTGRVLQILPDGKRQIVPKSDNRYGRMVKGVDRLLNQPQPELTTETPTDGDGRFLGDSTYSRKRNRARPYGRDVNMGYSPQFAQQNQSYSPDVMSRVGQGGVLENYGTVMLPGAKPEWELDAQGNIVLDGNGNPIAKARWSNYPGDERPTTLIYQNKGNGEVIPSIYIPVPGQKNQLLPISQIDRTTMSPAQRRLLEDIPTPQYATNDQLSQWAVGKVKVGEDTTIRPLENKPGSYQTNYRSTYVDAKTGDVYNVTSDKTGKFHLIRPEISEESYGFPRHKQTTNLTQEMIDINQGMKIGGNETITDTIREDPSIPGLDYFSEPVVAGLNPITGRPEIKYVHKGNLVNPFTGLPEKILPGEDYSQYAVLDEAGNAIPEGMFIRLWDRTMGIPKPPNVQLLGEPSKDAFKPIPRTWVNDDANTNDLFNYWQLNQESQGQSMVVNDLVRGAKRTAGGKVTPAYQSLQDSDYLGRRLAYNEDGIVIDTDVSDRPNYLYNLPGKGKEREYPYLYSYPYQDGDVSSRVVTRKNNAAKGIRNFTPASDFYSQGSQVVRRVVNGIPQEIIYDPNRSQQQVSNTIYQKLPVNPANVPIGAYRVNEYGMVEVFDDGTPIKIVGFNKEGKIVPNKYLPRSAQIANAGSRSFPGIENAPRFIASENPELYKVSSEYNVAYPYRFDFNFKGSTPQYEYPDGMSEAEAYRLGLIKEVYQGKGKRALDDRYQIPVPNGVGFIRVLPFEDSRTQAALAAQEVALQNAAQAKYSVPAIQRDYEIKPSRTAGIDSSQYAMFSDLEGRPSDDTARFWKENIPGVIPPGVVEGAYIPITMNPRNEQGRKPAPEVLMPGINGRIMKGKDIKFYGYAPLDLEYAMSHVDPRDMNKLLGEGLAEDVIKQRVLDNTLANAQIELDGKYYPLTREATEPFFDATPNSKYYQASNNVAFRGANVNSPIINDVLGEPSDDWIREQMAKGNLNFSPENWMSDNERVTLRQREIYADPSIEPRDIVDAVDMAQRRKNVIDAKLSNIEQRERARYEFNKNLASIDELQKQSDGLRDAINYASQTGQNLQAAKLLERKRQLDLAIQSRQANVVNSVGDWHLPELNQDATINPGQTRKWNIKNSVGEFIQSPLAEPSPSQVVVENDAMFFPSVPRQPRMSLAKQSRHLEDEIRRATIAHNQLIGVENSPEITITRTGNANELEAFLDAANAMKLRTLDGSSIALDNPSATVVGSLPFNQEQTVYQNTKRLDAPYTVLSSGRQDTLLPSHRTSQLFTPVPTSNMRDLSREPMPFPEEVITTSQVVPQGNVVVSLPSSSGNYPFRSGGNANYQTWDIPSTDGLGLLGFDGGSIPGDYIPDNPRTLIPSEVRQEPKQPRISPRTPVNPKVEPEMAMAGTKIPKWAIPASLGAAWLALAGYQRSRKEQEERQRQQVNM